MEYNNPSEIVKDLSFGTEAKSKIMHGVDKLANAVKSTLGASGKCVIYEDAMGRTVITKDGVTVAESVVLYDPVENLSLIQISEPTRQAGISYAVFCLKKKKKNKKTRDARLRE